MKNNTGIMILITLVALGLGFFGGMKYQQSKVRGGLQGGFNRLNSARGGARDNPGRFGMRGGATLGEVVAMDTNSVTVKLTDGSSKIVNLSSTTTYSKTELGTKADLKMGDRVAVFGSVKSDGSVAAQNVQLNPMFRNPAGGTVTPTR